MIVLLHQIILYVLERIFQKEYKLIVTIDGKIGDEKLQYDIKKPKKEAAKIPALSLGKIDKYEYLTGEEILTFN